MIVKVKENIYDVVKKRKLKSSEKVVGICRTMTGKRFNLIHSGKTKLMMPE